MLSDVSEVKPDNGGMIDSWWQKDRSSEVSEVKFAKTPDIARMSDRCSHSTASDVSEVKFAKTPYIAGVSNS